MLVVKEFRSEHHGYEEETTEGAHRQHHRFIVLPQAFEVDRSDYK
jgi:hypothetical protein